LRDQTSTHPADNPGRVWFDLRFPTTTTLDGPKIENLLLRSYLALSGANHAGTPGFSPPECNDGILTALELSALDLWGTKLVVLSACESGLGDVQNGEGVYGLRRALIIAGSESQMISLWSIDDQTIQSLLTNYYKNLRNRMDRNEALRRTQLAFLRRRNKALTHPYYWAAFIHSGSWKRMDASIFTN
jgi:CHAT domain-containing protein